MTPWFFFATDDNYADPLRVALKSLSATTRVKANAVVAAAHPEALVDLLALKNVDVHLTPLRDTFASWKANIHHITTATFARLDVLEYVPGEVERVVYADCDVLFVDDVSDLFDLDLRDNLVAMVPHQSLGHVSYYNAGVVVFELGAIRAAGVNLIERAKSLYDGGDKVNDQTILNDVFDGRAYTLPWVYNAQLAHWPFSEKFASFKRLAKLEGRSDVKVVHYMGHYKPWGPTPIIGGRLYQEYVTGTSDPEKVRKLLLLFMKDTRRRSSDQG